ncbi:MAG: HEAT repeat domain-containing protein [Lacipirellulaceae bacterium]
MNSLPTLAHRLLHGEMPDRLAAIEEINLAGEGAATIAAAVVQACDEPELAPLCVGVLEELGPPAEGQLAALATLLASPIDDCVYWAATLLGRCGAKSAPHVGPVSAVAERHTSESVRRRAVWALGKIGPHAANSLPLVERLAKSDSPALASQAAEALAAIRGA